MDTHQARITPHNSSYLHQGRPVYIREHALDEGQLRFPNVYLVVDAQFGSFYAKRETLPLGGGRIVP